jgi:hypothetical protein
MAKWQQTLFIKINRPAKPPTPLAFPTDGWAWIADPNHANFSGKPFFPPKPFFGTDPLVSLNLKSLIKVLKLAWML